ncbi:MAG: metallophosphoesterase, partial [Bacteroidia bacterium]|nr:metallophosphoesterase [Bacteroidia bacterium]
SQTYFSKPSPDAAETAKETVSISRSEFLIKIGLLIASIPFLSLIYGMVHGASNLSLKRKKVHLSHLPDVFEGLKIVQISDLHTGSFVNDKILRNAVELINEQKADLILFTGDLVNSKADEVEPYIPILKQLSSTHGVFSITGNHDYGDYVRWPSKQHKQDNFDRLVNAHKLMGWDLLLDEHRNIEKDGERITVIGVQNWSANLRFPKYGNLTRASENVDQSAVNILLSHDPSHWRGEILERFKHIDITFSGHTHGAQFGVEIPGIKWSPVKYFYKEWAGLYEHAEQYLYVNRGLGFLGYPGRVGMLPEITLLELHKKQA